jgi:hypothetical protein
MFIDKRADFSRSSSNTWAFLSGIDHSAIANDIVRCRYYI